MWYLVLVYVYMTYACGIVGVSYVYGVVSGCGCECSVIWRVCVCYMCDVGSWGLWWVWVWCTHMSLEVSISI